MSSTCHRGNMISFSAQPRSPKTKMAERKRNPNWTEEEKAILLKEYSRRKEILTSRFNPAVTSVIKQKHWEEITDCVNSQNPTVKRTIQEVKKKYENLSTAAKKEYREFKKTARKRVLQEPAKPPGPSPLKAISISSSPALTPRIVAVSSFALPTNSRPEASALRPPLLVHRPQRLTSVLPPCASAGPPSNDPTNTPKGAKESGSFGAELNRIHSAITDCGDRIVAAMDPIAASLRELNQHLGNLVDVLARQPGHPCRNTAVQMDHSQGEPHTDNSLVLIEPKVEESSPSYLSTSSTRTIGEADKYR